jgi:membrane protease YdiL (CAAX protease family)
MREKLKSKLATARKKSGIHISNRQNQKPAAEKRFVENIGQFYKRDPITSAILIILVFFASQLSAGVLIALYPGIKNWTGDQGQYWLQNSVIAQFVYILLAEFFAVWLVLWLLRRARIAKARIGLIRPVLIDVVWALAGYAAYFVCYLIIANIAGHFINADQQQKIGFDGAHGRELIYVFASLVVLPPIAEEIMFRGFLFTSFRQKFRVRYAVILTSLLFGIAHLQFGSGAPLLWVAALDTFTLSCVLCTLREKSGSLWPGIYLHALKNGIAFIYLFHAKF